MRARRDEYLSRFVIGHASTPERLRLAMRAAFQHADVESLEHAVLMVHGLQGTAAMLGLHAIHELGAALEQALEAQRAQLGTSAEDARAAMLAAVDLLQSMLTDVAVEAPLAPETAELASALRRSG